MTWLEMAAVFGSSFAMVLAYGIQSRAVQHGRYALAFLGSTGIGLLQTLVTRAAVGDDLQNFLLASCLGGSFGICASIYAYENLIPAKRSKGVTDVA